MVDFSGFNEFVQELDPLYSIPCRKEFGAAAEKKVCRCKVYYECTAYRCRKDSIHHDIWTKIGMTSSFLGVTAHWFDRKS